MEDCIIIHTIILGCRGKAKTGKFGPKHGIATPNKSLAEADCVKSSGKTEKWRWQHHLRLTTATAFLNTVDCRISPVNSQPLRRLFPAKKFSRILAMAPKKKGMQVNKYDKGWKKEWFGAGIFFEGSEEIEVDVFKKLEKRKVLSNVEKAGLLSKAEELGFTLSSIEKLGILSKAEEFGLLSLLETAAGYSPAALASAALPVLVAAILAVVFIPDDSAALVAVQAVYSRYACCYCRCIVCWFDCV
ncbi:hypothetical protein R6Q57_000455 [Mikania cordata]